MFPPEQETLHNCTLTGASFGPAFPYSAPPRHVDEESPISVVRCQNGRLRAPDYTLFSPSRSTSFISIRAPFPLLVLDVKVCRLPQRSLKSSRSFFGDRALQGDPRCREQVDRKSTRLNSSH